MHTDFHIYCDIFLLCSPFLLFYKLIVFLEKGEFGCLHF